MSSFQMRDLSASSNIHHVQVNSHSKRAQESLEKRVCPVSPESEQTGTVPRTLTVLLFSNGSTSQPFPQLYHRQSAAFSTYDCNTFTEQLFGEHAHVMLTGEAAGGSSSINVPLPPDCISSQSEMSVDELAATTPTPFQAQAPPPAALIPVDLFMPSPPTCEKNIAYEIVHRHEFATRLSKSVLTRLSIRNASVVLLYVVPAARIDTCSFHRPPRYGKRPTRTISEDNGKIKTEKQCGLCLEWITATTMSRHRRRHCPSVWKCEHCVFCVFVDPEVRIGNIQKAMRDHYQNCRGDLGVIEIEKPDVPRIEPPGCQRHMEVRGLQYTQSPPSVSLSRQSTHHHQHAHTTPANPSHRQELLFPAGALTSQSTSYYRTQGINNPDNGGALLSAASCSSSNTIHTQTAATEREKCQAANGRGLKASETVYPIPAMASVEAYGSQNQSLSAPSSSPLLPQQHACAQLIAPHYGTNWPSDLGEMIVDLPVVHNIRTQNDASFAQYLFGDGAYDSYIEPDLESAIDGVQPYQGETGYYNLPSDTQGSNDVQIGKRKCEGVADEEDKEREYGDRVHAFGGAQTNKKQHTDSVPLSVANQAEAVLEVVDSTIISNDIWLELAKATEGEISVAFQALIQSMQSRVDS